MHLHSYYGGSVYSVLLAMYKGENASLYPTDRQTDKQTPSYRASDGRGS